MFAEVQGLIQDMIDRLQKEAASDATEKAFSDEERARTKEKTGTWRPISPSFTWR